jgi:predicted TIM-barrel fold metal-dependent hydrolase
MEQRDMEQRGGAVAESGTESRRTSSTTALLPDPEPRELRYTVISVDDHLVEPADMFVRHVPQRYKQRCPRVVDSPTGGQQWVYDGQVFEQLGLNAVVGHPRKEDWTFEPTRYEEMRPGCFDVDRRVADMDIDGVWASVCFPSMVTGFCGSVFSRTRDPDLGLAVMRAWNDWFFEEWYGSHPQRFIPMGITWLADPEVGAAEVRRNADRGFKAVSFPEQPHRLGYPSLHSGHWDPILRACEETETVVCLHVSSSGPIAGLADDVPRPAVGATLFQAQALVACADWLWSGVAVKFPNLKIAMSEGGIGWVPMLVDRLEYMMAQSGHGRNQWTSRELSPVEVLRRNFWFCTIDDPSTMPLRDRIGVDRIMVEVDYPHADSTWPDTQEFLSRTLKDVPVDEVRAMTHLNAAALFRHPLPDICLP